MVAKRSSAIHSRWSTTRQNSGQYRSAWRKPRAMKWPSRGAVLVRQRVRRGEVALVRQVVDVEHARAGDRHAHRPHPSRHQRHVDDGADTSALALEQRGADAPGERHARLQVAEAGTRHRRRELLPRRRDADGGARATPVRDPVEAPLPGERSARALGRPPAVHDPRVAAHHVGGLDAELGPRRRQEVRDEHIGRVDERHQDVAALVGVDVDADGPLATVADLEEVRHALDPSRHPPGRDLADRIAPRRVLDLQHLGTPVGEDGGRRRDEHEARHLEHTDALQRTWHSTPPSHRNHPETN